MTVIYRAAAALSSADRGAAIAGLRGQLTTMVTATGGTPDWMTLEVRGPVQVRQPRGGEWFEFSATVAVEGGMDLADDPLDTALPRRRTSVAAEETAPQQRLRHVA